MRAELFDKAGTFVASYDCPPFKLPPDVMLMGERAFMIAAGDATHLPNCNSITKQVLDKDQVAGCSCDPAYAYDEAVTWKLADMHKIEAVRSAPITRKAK